MKIDEGLWVDKNADVSELKTPRSRSRGCAIEPYVVAQARASAALHAETKAALLR